jgi:hypothetical protein
METCAPAPFAERIGGFSKKRESLQSTTAFPKTDPA